MHQQRNIKALAAKHICHQCIGDAFLSKQIQRAGQKVLCDYCDEVEPSFTIGELAVSVEKAFDDHYIRTPDQPDAWQHYDWFRDGEPVLNAIEGAANISRQVASDVLMILADEHADPHRYEIGEECEFAQKAHYEEMGIGSGAWQREWREFERSLKAEARFFSKSAAAHLGFVFGGIDKIKTRNGRSLVVCAGPKRTIKHLYRARVFQTDQALEEALCRPDLKLGSPPAQLANAGRMNARGISVFYGATAASTAIAEVRPPVGSKVAVVKFVIKRPLRLLDLTALGLAMDDGSIFDPDFKARLERVAFLRTLGDRMTRPVMPDDEALDYLATQAVADFLATENHPVFDGIIYGSVQARDGHNVVLFHKAARVQELELPRGTNIKADSYMETDEGPEINYWVSERVPAILEKSSFQDDKQDWPLDFPQFDDQGPDDLSRAGQWDDRQATLIVDAQSVEVHWIDWVRFRSTRHKVSRHRTEQQEEKF
jgi:hypothetical protein